MQLCNVLIHWPNFISMLMVFLIVFVMFVSHVVGGVLLPIGIDRQELSPATLAIHFFTYLGVQLIGMIYILGFLPGTVVASILSSVYIVVKFVLWKRTSNVITTGGGIEEMRPGMRRHIALLTTFLEFFILFGTMWILACLAVL
jgi:hypothetical protein